ncbi:MAG: adenine nucleotide alpha hydrolase family protein [Anaerolineales bacterium]|nr:adenine nucleotide alpha hydrolase family protein [Anaerolineales bacterium]
MREHKLALCKEHFLTWIPEQVQRAIDTYQMFAPEDRILVAVSGGKDSLALWEILNQLGYATDGLYIDLGIESDGGYSSRSRQVVQAFANQRDLTLHIVDVRHQEGASIQRAAQIARRGSEKTCSVCGLTKRHIMNQTARGGKYDVIVTGHNLDDEAAILLGNTLNWLSGYLVRQEPVLPATDTGFARKAKPLCRLYEREIAAYAFLNEIEYIHDECPHAKGANSIFYKETLNRMETTRPGTKLAFYLSFLKAKREGMFATPTNAAQEFHICPSCSQPTFNEGECAYCRLWNQVRAVIDEAR